MRAFVFYLHLNFAQARIPLASAPCRLINLDLQEHGTIEPPHGKLRGQGNLHSIMHIVVTRKINCDMTTYSL
jgi:hypothetical protein